MSQQFCCQKKLQVYVILYFILLENEFFYCLNNSTTKPEKSYDVGFRIVGGAICAVKYPFFVSQTSVTYNNIEVIILWFRDFRCRFNEKIYIFVVAL